ncbi:hypothetical protein MWH03_35910, partial [Klebsiella pneumoniae]|nr:hypothetical protein [Klebsiella pneumoniae]
DPVGRGRRSRRPAKSRVPSLKSRPAALRLRGPAGCEPVKGSCRPGKAPPPGTITGIVPDISPGGDALARAYGV